MEALTRAIQVRYNDEGVLKAALTGGLHLTEAPMEVPVAFPYGVVKIHEERPFWTFRNDFEGYRITMLFASKEISATEIMDIQQKVKDCFDDRLWVVEGYHKIRFWREIVSFDRADDTWLALFTYRCQLEKT